MQFTLATIALAAASIVSAQGVSSKISPTAAAPASCSTDYASSFEITVVLPPVVGKRDVAPAAIEKRDACASDGTLVANLKGSVLTDAKGRIGAIVANRQFQFDGPPAQTGSIFTAGWSVCSNGSLALGGSSIFYQCLSGTFYNLYDQNAGALCQQVLINVIPCGSSAGASQAGDGQATAASATHAASQISDGQPQAASATLAPKITQIGDGQVQASSAVVAPPPVSQFTDGQLQVTAKATLVAQITDGQIQASAAKTAAPVVTPVAQITDGQIQASVAKSVAPAVTPVAQITDGQIQASKAATTLAPLVSPVAQISDGQVQAGNATAVAPKPPTFTGAASNLAVGAQFAFAAVAGVAVALF